MAALNRISPKFKIFGINPEEVFSIKGGKIIATFTSINFYDIWTFPSWRKFWNGKVGSNFSCIAQN